MQDLREMEIRIMSVITDAMSTVQGDFDAENSKLTAIAVGITNLDQLIINFQNSPGQITPADQTALDNIIAASASLRAQVSSINTDVPGSITPAQTSSAKVVAVGGSGQPAVSNTRVTEVKPK